MKKLNIALLIVLCAISAAVNAQGNIIIDRVLAVVGDNVVLQSEVEAQYQQMLSGDNNGDSLPPNAKCRIFENLLMDKLFVSQAQIDSVVASPDEVDAELDRRLKYFISVFGSAEKLEEYYGKSILELKDDFREDIEKQLVADKVKAKIFTNLKVSPADVQDFFNRIPEDSIPYFNSELEMGEIVMFPTVNAAEKKRSREKIESIRREIIEGADFSVKAITNSEDPGSYLDGGSLGVISRGELVPEFEAVAFKLKEGELSDVVETPFGYHLIIVDEKRGDKLKLRHILIKPKILNYDLTIVKKTMDSILHELRVDSLSWRDAVRQYSMEEQSKSIGGMMTNPKSGTTYFEKADIDGTLIFTIDRMKVGEYSDVLPYSGVERTGEPKQGYRIIWLKTETKPHKASLDQDYPKIQAAAKAEKQHQIMDNWVNLHLDRNFVRIEDDSYNCPEIERWKKNRRN